MTARKQHLVTKEQDLLDERGNIAEPGYATKPIWRYHRNQIKANKLRIKEWDYYYVGDNAHGIALTIADAGYISSIQTSLFGFGVAEDEPFQINYGVIGFFPLGKLNMPHKSSSGTTKADVKGAHFIFEHEGKNRHLHGRFENYNKSGSTLTFDLTLGEEPQETMVIATPFDADKHFYYNQKINCMPANGTVTFEGKTYRFSAENGAMGVLDWGRGVWTRNNRWYWGSGSMLLDDGSAFGYNIGYGFGNTSAASENMLFYNGKAHKLDDVIFHIPKRPDGSYDYLSPWSFTETNKRFEMRFEPILDRYDPVDLKIISMKPHQTFGRLYGTAILDDGKQIELTGQVGLAEHVHNCW